MSPQRFKIETTILDKYFPNKYNFQNLSQPNEFLDVGVKTQSGTVYRLNIKLKPDYPSSMPEVYVVYPLPLKTKSGRNLSGASHDMHTLSNEGNHIQICHFKKENWNANQTLFKIIMKVRIWFEAYEGHLATGKKIDDYLKS